MIDFFDTVSLGLSVFCAVNIIMSNETIVLIRNLFVGEPLNFEIAVTAGLIVSLLLVFVAAFGIVNFIMKNPFEIGSLFHNNTPAILIVLGSIPIFLVITWFVRNTIFTVTSLLPYSFHSSSI